MRFILAVAAAVFICVSAVSAELSEAAKHAIAKKSQAAAPIESAERDTLKPTASVLDEIASLKAEYAQRGYEIPQPQQYTTHGDYLGYGQAPPLKPSTLPIPLNESGIVFDENGYPLLKRRHLEGLYFNPVTHAQFALAAYGRIRTSTDRDFFLGAADKLVREEGPAGEFRYHFYFRHYTMEEPYADGWVSALAQGQALSVFARAYRLTRDEKYRISGDKALDFLLTPEEDGGPATTLADLDPALSDSIFLEEYVTEPDVYTLNGYIFTLLGIYDWWQATGSIDAQNAFKDGIRTLNKILPLYDVSGFSAYDLSYLTNPDFAGHPHMAANYHRIHIQLLYALASVTDNLIFKATADRWASSVTK